MKKILIILLLTLTGCSNNLGAELTALSTGEAFDLNLKTKPAKEKVELKSKELAKVKLSKFKKDDIDIEIIGDIKEIDGGIELFAKAWKNGEQLGFGKDGTVEIERFRFFNPPVLVDDENGDIVRERQEEDIITKKKTLKQRKLKYDPQEAIKQSLAHTLGIVAKDGKNIKKGKVGNTTSTFYPDADPESTSVDGALYYNDATGASWATVRDAASALGGGSTGTIANVVTVLASGKYEIDRAYFLFDTSALGDTDTIDSAVFSVFESTSHTTVNTDTTTAELVASTPATNTDIVIGDYDQIGSVSFASVAYSVFATDAYQDFTLNASGLANISKTGVSKFGLRDGRDLNNNAPTGLNRIQVYMSDTTGAASDPKLVVEHSVAVSPATPPLLIFD